MEEQQHISAPVDEVPREALSPLQVIVVVVYLIVAVWYLAWRPSSFSAESPVFSGVLYAAELFGFGVSLLNIFMLWRLSVRESPEPLTDARIDVFVTTYDEPVEMLRRTLLAAVRMDLPHVTWLLDDGNRPEMKALAVELGVRYVNRSNNLHAKAGNLNNALRQASGEFVAVFDADHAPSRNFLTRTLGYFRDPEVAFVSTPQDFYNLDSFQHRSPRGGQMVWNEQSLFFRVIQRGKDTHNAAFFCGTCGVLRRTALDEIGGFATDTVTEDLDTSLRIHRRGWKSVYHAESLAFGVAPADMAPFLKQRTRWGQGAMQVLRSHRFILFASGLTFAQKLNYLASTVTYLDGWQKAVFYLAPVVVLLTGWMPISDFSPSFLIRFIPYYLLTFLVFEEMGRGYGRFLDVERYNMARFAAFIWATLALFRTRLRFGVTSKARTGDQATIRRLMLPQSSVLLLNAAAIPLGIAFVAMGTTSLPQGAIVANVFWAFVNASLAFVVILFSRRLSSFRRREYRFPVPLPVLLDLSGRSPQAGVLDDVSGHGFRYYGLFPAQIGVGDMVSGEVILPEARVRFRARVRARLGAGADNEARSLGCEFDWEKPGDGDELLAFLYGSDLQWKLNRIAEKTRTPLERFVRWVRRVPADARDMRTQWAPVLIRASAAEEPGPGVISVQTMLSTSRTLVSFRQLSSAKDLTIFVTTRAGTQTLRGDAEPFDTMVSSGTPLYVYRFEGRPNPQTAPAALAA